MKQLSTNELVNNANANKRIEKEILINFKVGSDIHPRRFIIRSSDIKKVINDWQDIEEREYAECVILGLSGLPINEEKWQENREMLMKKATTKEQIEEVEKQRPKDLADQRSKVRARTVVLQTIIPKIIRDSKTGEKAFNTLSEKEAFGEFISDDAEAAKAVTEAYVAIMLEYGNAQDAAKNSQAGKASKNSSSNATLPANTQATETPSTKDS